MALLRATPQQLDPLGGVTAQAFSWLLGTGALATALIVSILQWSESDPVWLGGAIAALAAAVIVAVLGSSPRRAPFTWRSAVLIHVLGLAAIGLEAASRWGAEGAADSAWGPAALSLLIIVTASFRPAAEVAIESTAASLVVFGIALASGASASVPLPFVAAANAAIPVIGIGAAGTAYSYMLVRRLLAWREDTGRQRRAETLRLRAQAREELRVLRLGLVEREIEPFLRHVVATGGSDPESAAEARRLAAELRALLSVQREEVWLAALVRAFDDPDHLAPKLDETQRAAVDALCAALGERDPRAALRRRGSGGALVLTWGRGPGVIGPELAATIRQVFPGARLALTSRRIELGFSVD